MQIQTPDGGMTTTDDHVDHTRWPCVPHEQGVPCEEAIRLWQRRAPEKVNRAFADTRGGVSGGS